MQGVIKNPLTNLGGQIPSLRGEGHKGPLSLRERVRVRVNPTHQPTQEGKPPLQAEGKTKGTHPAQTLML